MTLPPPVTRNSSKKELWEELECSRQEIDALQRQLNERETASPGAEAELELLRYQLSVIRAAAAVAIKLR